MANRIKGITIEIGGDTTGLDKALRNVNSTIKSTESALKDVNRLLKLDPSNAELLSQKQRLLGDEIKATSTKLETLKEADEKAKAQLESGTLGQDKYDALQREIIETESKLKTLQDEAKKVPSAIAASMQELGAKMKGVGDKTAEVGKNLSTYVTVPLAGIGAASAAAFNEVDAGVDTIIQKTGASGKALDGMQKSMENLATTIPTDFATAGSAIGEVNTRFGLTGQALEDLSGQFVKFAQLNNVDVSAAVDQTQKVLSAFGLSANDAGLLLDTMNAVGQRTGISMDTLSQSMITNAASLTQMGFSASDAANFLGNVEMSGADTSQVMSGLTKALANAAESGKPMKQALSELQASMVNAGSETEGLQIAYELFGKRAGAAIYQACKNGSLSFEELGTSLQDSTGNVNATFEGTIDPIDSFKTTLNELKLVGADVGASLMTVLKPMLEKVAEVLRNLKKSWDGLSPGMQDAIVKIGLIAAVVGPVLVTVGKVISAVGTISSALGSLIGLITGTAGATTAMGAAGSAGAAGTAAAGTAAAGASAGFGALSASLLPIIGIIAAVVVAIAAIILIIKNWGAITEWFKGVWVVISEAVKNIWTGISAFFSSVWQGIADFFKSIWEGIKNVVSFALQFIVELVKTYFALITLPYRLIWENCKDVVIAVFNTIKSVITTIFNAIASFISTTLNTIKTVFTTIWNAISSVISTVLNMIKGIVVSVFNAIKATVSSVWNGIKSIIASVVDGISSKVSAVVNGISSTVSSVFNGIKSVATSVWNGIKDAIVTPIENAKNILKGIVDRISGFFSGLKISLPHIKLPHFNISGGFSIVPPRVPHLSIDWYKEGGIMSKPTIFGMNGSSLMAGGEAGKEAILPLSGFYNQLESMLDSKLSMGNMESYLKVIAENSIKNIILDSGVLVGELAPGMNEKLGSMMKNAERRMR